jgi:hypothetical protein
MAAGMDRCLGQRKIRDGRHAAAVRRQTASSGGSGVAMVVRLGSLVGRRRRLWSRLGRPGRLGFFSTSTCQSKAITSTILGIQIVILSRCSTTMQHNTSPLPIQSLTYSTHSRTKIAPPRSLPHQTSSESGSPLTDRCSAWRSLLPERRRRLSHI